MKFLRQLLPTTCFLLQQTAAVVFPASTRDNAGTELFFRWTVGEEFSVHQQLLVCKTTA